MPLTAVSAPLLWARAQPDDRPRADNVNEKRSNGPADTARQTETDDFADLNRGVSRTVLRAFGARNPELRPLPLHRDDQDDQDEYNQLSHGPAFAFAPLVHSRSSRPLAVHFLMSCHSTPFFAFTHGFALPMRQLDCAPKYEDGKKRNNEIDK